MTDHHVISRITKDLAGDPVVCAAASLLCQGGSGKNRTGIMRVFARLGAEFVEEGGIMTGLRLVPEKPPEVQYARELLIRAAIVPPKR